MNKEKGLGKETLFKIEEKYRLPLMVFALLPVLFTVTDTASGIVSGLAAVLVFLLLEEGMFFLGKYLTRGWRETAYGLALAALCGIAGILLQLALLGRTGAPLWSFIVGQITSVYILYKLLGAQEKENPAKKEEKPVEEKESPAETGTAQKSAFRILLECFETAAQYMLFLVLLGFLREFMGQWLGTAGLLSGGFMLSAGLLLLWKLTKTMPENLQKLPHYTLSAGLILLALAGFASLL